MKTSKLVGVLVVLAVLGLSLGDALTGHGIRGNKNLNPMVVGDETDASGESTTTTPTTTTDNSGCSTSEMYTEWYGYVNNIYRVTSSEHKRSCNYPGLNNSCSFGIVTIYYTGFLAGQPVGGFVYVDCTLGVGNL